MLITHGSYQAVDLGLEGSLVMGMLGGYVTGLLAGVLISIPAMFHGELMTMPLLAAVGVMGGLLRDVAPDKEAIWKLHAVPGSGDRPPAAQAAICACPPSASLCVLRDPAGGTAAANAGQLSCP